MTIDELLASAYNNLLFSVAINDGDEKFAEDILFQHTDDDNLVYATLDQIFYSNENVN